MTAPPAAPTRSSTPSPRCCILLLAPVMLAVAIAVKLDGGPVLFRQSRVGKHGTEFGMLARTAGAVARAGGAY
ncbi:MULTISPECIES: sugar transferase [unclassified Pseudonocardia]|uniref:sugar transferase n=1 Tax=unclassified Pseudonocardia TaxID=2619320 RepID=UPI0027DEEC55|nr:MULTISPECIES: sugar transferase [unclassified Pseudonocardia]